MYGRPPNRRTPTTWDNVLSLCETLAWGMHQRHTRPSTMFPSRQYIGRSKMNMGTQKVSQFLLERAEWDHRTLTDLVSSLDAHLSVVLCSSILTQNVDLEVLCCPDTLNASHMAMTTWSASAADGAVVRGARTTKGDGNGAVLPNPSPESESRLLLTSRIYGERML
jgi:hypothetical protein